MSNIELRGMHILEMFAEAQALGHELDAVDEARERKRVRDAARWWKREAKKRHGVQRHEAQPQAPSPLRHAIIPAPGSIQERRMLARAARKIGG